MREEWTRAHNQAIRLSILLDLASRHAFEKVAARIPGTELQIAIALFLAGDTLRALRHASRAHSAADLDEIGYVERDAAGKAALLHAARGDISAASEWLQLSDSSARLDSAVDAAIESSRTAARALVAAARLDRSELTSIMADMGWGVGAEELWAVRLHAMARIGLVLGDAIGMRRLLAETPAILPFTRTPAPPIRDLLLADAADMAMALGAGNRALTILAAAERGNPVIDMCEARLRLLCGDPAVALAISQSALASEDVTSRVEVEALVLSAVAQERLGRRDEAARCLQMASIRSDACGSIHGFATVPFEELSELAEAIGHELPDGIRQLFPPDLMIVDLSAREATVLDHLVEGRSMAEISDLDFVSVNTVKTQVRSLYRKLGAENRGAAVDIARSLGIL